MILFHAKANGQVTTTPSLVPQGSSMQDLVVLSELDYAFCTIKLEPASGIEIPDVVCTFVKTERDTTLWTAKLPPEAAKVAGKVTYSLEFTAADGTVQPTLSGSFTVPRRAKTTIPENVDGLKQYTVNELFGLLSDIYASMTGSDAEIALLLTRLTSQGTVTIDPTQWTNTTPLRADVFMPGDVFSKGCVVLFAPEDDTTKDAAGKAMLSMTIGGTVDQNTPSPDYVVIARAESGEAPTIPLNFRYIVLKTGTEDKALVAMVGVDATGDGGGLDEEAVRDLINEALQEFDPGSGGGLTDLEVRLIINEVVPRWALQQTAPVTRVNNKTGAVTLSASDVGADAAGTAATKVSDHDTYTGSHSDIRLLLQTLSNRLNAFLDTDDTTLDELSEIVAYIKSNKALIDSITASKVNVTDIINNLTSNVSNKPLSAAQGAVLKGLIDAINSKNYITEDEADDKYLTDAALPTKVSQLNNDSGYITQTTADGRYAKSEDIPTTPSEVGADPEGTAADVAAQVAEDLKSYYKKTETYSKTEVDGKISAIPKFAISVVSSLPTSGISATTVYLVKNKTTSGDLYTEYIYVNNAWEELGKQAVNLSGYVTTSALSTALASYAKTSAIPTNTSQLNNDSNFAVTTKAETWTFTLESGSTVTKKVVLA